MGLFFCPHFSWSGGFGGKKYSKIMVRSIAKYFFVSMLLVGIILFVYSWVSPDSPGDLYHSSGFLIIGGVCGVYLYIMD